MEFATVQYSLFLVKYFLQSEIFSTLPLTKTCWRDKKKRMSVGTIGNLSTGGIQWLEEKEKKQNNGPLVIFASQKLQCKKKLSFLIHSLMTKDNMMNWFEMAAIEKIVEGDGVITVYFSSPYEVEVDNIREGFQRISQTPDCKESNMGLLWVILFVIMTLY